MKPKSKAYTQMYLVPPSVYEKMLTCLDQIDTKNVEKLNKPEEIIEKPSSNIIQQIVEKEI